MKIVFFGSGPVAAESLEKLLSWADIELIVTKRRAEHHKDPAPVETIANTNNIKLSYANTKKELEKLILDIKPKSKIGLVIDYGVIISKPTIEYFELGIVNSHFSLLPAWRGADPITFSILSGQTETGVTLMTIDEGLDTGPILVKSKFSLDDSWNNQQLTAELIDLSDQLLQENVPKYIDGTLTPQPQLANDITTYSRMLTKHDAILDPNKPASQLAREIRAYSEWPKSKLILKNGQQLIITEAVPAEEQLDIGQIIIVDNKMLLGCRIGSLNITALKPAGKKSMDVRSFLNGYHSWIK